MYDLLKTDIPYRNTLGDVLKVPLDDPKSLCFRMCFYMVEAVGLEPTTYRLKAGYSSL